MDVGVIVDEELTYKPSSAFTYALERVLINDDSEVRDMFDFRTNKVYAKCNFTRVQKLYE